MKHVSLQVIIDDHDDADDDADDDHSYSYYYCRRRCRCAAAAAVIDHYFIHSCFVRSKRILSLWKNRDF